MMTSLTKFFSDVPLIAHEMEAKNMGIWLRQVDKTYRFLVTSGCLLSRNVWWAVQIGSFWLKNEYFTDPNGPKDEGALENEFWVFSNSEMNVTKSYSGNIRWKKWGHLSSFHVSFLSYLKKCIFYNLVLTSAKNLSLLKQFTNMHLKGLVTHFQKMVLFIMLWRTVSEILGFEVEGFC